MPTTNEAVWLELLTPLPRWVPPAIPTVVLSPHPDDETLGAGGLIAAQRRAGVSVTVIAVTDGEAAYDDVKDLGGLRRREQQEALQALGVTSAQIQRLSLPDSKVNGFEESLERAVRPHVHPGVLIVAPWAADPHPDHEATGLVAERLSIETGAQLASYLFWTWHWKSPDFLQSVPLHRFDLDEELQVARRAALLCHDSQLRRSTGPPILPDNLLSPARRPFETYIVRKPAERT